MLIIPSEPLSLDLVFITVVFILGCFDIIGTWYFLCLCSLDPSQSEELKVKCQPIPTDKKIFVFSFGNQCLWDQHEGPPACSLQRFVATREPARPIPLVCLWSVCSVETQRRKKKENRSASLWGWHACSFPRDQSMENSPRIKVWSWVEFILQAVREVANVNLHSSPADVYAENKSLLNFLSLLWKYLFSVYACDTGKYSTEEYRRVLKTQVFWSKLHTWG